MQEVGGDEIGHEGWIGVDLECYKGVCTLKVSGSHWSVGAFLTTYTLTSLSVIRAVLGGCCIWKWCGGGTAAEKQSYKQQEATKQ